MRPNILIFSHWKRPLERDYSSCRLFCSSTLNDHLLPAKQQTNQASNYAAGKQLIFMSGHASKIGNDVSQTQAPTVTRLSHTWAWESGGYNNLTF